MNFGLDDFLPVLDREDWLWHSCHMHYHSMEAFVNYDILDPHTGLQIAEGHKASFCLEDSTCVSGSVPHFQCSRGIQGISVNCGDLYASHLDCQWIDITGMQGGVYILQHKVNPDRLVVESDYLNNVMSCRMNLTANINSFIVQDCWLSGNYS